MIATKWIRIARSQDIPIREGRQVRVGEREIAIFNLGNDRFLAVESRCPHKDGPLADGIVSGQTVVCPLHAWKFNLETGEGASSASAGRCVETFTTKVEQGIVLVEIGCIATTADRACASPPYPEALKRSDVLTQ